MHAVAIEQVQVGTLRHRSCRHQHSQQSNRLKLF